MTRGLNPHTRGPVTPTQDAAWRRLWDRLLAEPEEKDPPLDAETRGGHIAHEQTPTRQNRTDDRIF